MLVDELKLLQYGRLREYPGVGETVDRLVPIIEKKLKKAAIKDDYMLVFKLKDYITPETESYVIRCLIFHFQVKEGLTVSSYHNECDGSAVVFRGWHV